MLVVVLLIPSWRLFYFFPENKTDKQIIQKSRLQFFDFLKGFSILAVILIHVGYFYWYYDNYQNRYLIDFLNNISRFCIPVFIISSGILLRPWREVSDKKAFYTRKITRIFVPYLLVVLLASLYYKASIGIFLKVLFSGTAYVPYYFIVVLAQLYLLYPLLDKYRQSKYFLLLSFIFSYTLTLLFDPIKIAGAVFFSKYLFFFCYGMYMRDFFLTAGQKDKREISMWGALVAIFIAISLYLPEMYFNFQIFYGLAIFNILYYYKDAIERYFKKIYTALASIGKLSLWVFLLHFPIARLVYLEVVEMGESLVVEIVLIFGITSILSISATILCDKLYSYFLSFAIND